MARTIYENINITDRIKNYEDACDLLGFNPLNEAKLIDLGLTKREIAYYKLIIIIKALNEGWIPNVCDNNNCRWYPYFCPNGSPSSFVFGNSNCGNSSAHAGSGFRLSLKNKELSDYCGKQFLELWKEYII